MLSEGQAPSGDAIPVKVDSGGVLATEFPNVTTTNRSGTIATGGQAQTLAAANTSRNGLWVQNLSTGDLWLSDVGTAAAGQPSMKLPPGAYYEFPPNGVPTTALSVYGATTGQAFAAREW
jgi:hypothetical protein